MTKIRLIGDVHGKWGAYKKIIRDCPHPSLQVGDMGVGFKRWDPVEERLVSSSNPPYDAMSAGDNRFIRGNHDSPDDCFRHPFWVPDGSFHHGIFCVGGAVSIDRAYRTEGIDWWADEELSLARLDQIVTDYSEKKPSVVVTHDCPESVAGQIMSTFNKTKIEDGSRTRQALEVMLYRHRPKLWVFGHWHHSIRFAMGGCLFVCLAELEHVDVDLDDYF